MPNQDIQDIQEILQGICEYLHQKESIQEGYSFPAECVKQFTGLFEAAKESNQKYIMGIVQEYFAQGGQQGDQAGGQKGRQQGGQRGSLSGLLNGNRAQKIKADTDVILKRVFVGDLLWLFYFEQMGVFQILGRIMDDFDTKGEYPILVSDKAVPVLQTLIQLTKTGASSTVRDRASTYQRCLGWTSTVGKKLSVESQFNKGFAQNFHDVIYWILQYYNSLSLPLAISASVQGAAGVANVSSSISMIPRIRDAIVLLRQSLKQFEYGDNHRTTVHGIAWAIAGIYLVYELKNRLGISYDTIEEVLSSAYSLLVQGGTATISDTNRFISHKECAENGRNILLELEGLDERQLDAPGYMKPWLEHIQTWVEKYHLAHRSVMEEDFSKPRQF